MKSFEKTMLNTVFSQIKEVISEYGEWCLLMELENEHSIITDLLKQSEEEIYLWLAEKYSTDETKVESRLELQINGELTDIKLGDWVVPVAGRDKGRVGKVIRHRKKYSGLRLVCYADQSWSYKNDMQWEKIKNLRLATREEMIEELVITSDGVLLENKHSPQPPPVEKEPAE